MAAQYVANIGRRIRERREELGLSQEDVARELPGKVSGNQVSRWERGLHRPNDPALEALGQALNVEVAYFLGDGPSTSADTAEDDSPPRPEQLDRIEAMLAMLVAHFDLRAPRPSEVADVTEQALQQLADTPPQSAPAPRRRRGSTQG
jgi:transcriptional regulator with XRE-family HTH domain